MGARPLRSPSFKLIAASARATAKRSRTRAALLIYDVRPPVLRPGFLVRAHRPRLLLAEAHRLDLRVRRAEQHQALLDRFRTLLSEREVVFAAAAFIRVALDHDAAVLRRRQVLAVRLDHRLELALDDEA